MFIASPVSLRRTRPLLRRSAMAASATARLAPPRLRLDPRSRRETAPLRAETIGTTAPSLDSNHHVFSTRRSGLELRGPSTQPQAIDKAPARSTSPSTSDGRSPMLAPPSSSHRNPRIDSDALEGPAPLRGHSRSKVPALVAPPNRGPAPKPSRRKVDSPGHISGSASVAPPRPWAIVCSNS